ncbi:methyl-accepting chemotaxis protein [Oxalobacteraceae bacterium GrIS 1.11]
MAGLGLVAVLMGLVFACWVTHSITNPIGYALRVARAVASGALSSHIESLHRDEAVASVQRVSDIDGAMNVSNHEQGDGIEQINQAISQIDHTTQQNATLVEQAAAAAAAMRAQAGELEQVVSQFRLGATQPPARARLRA